MRTMLAIVVLIAVTSPLAQETFAPQTKTAAQARFEFLVAEVQALQRRHTIHLRGAEHPEAFRYGPMLTPVFAYGGSGDDLAFAQYALESYGATGADVDVLKEAREAAVRAEVARAEQTAHADHCARLLDGSFRDAVALAQYIVEQDERPMREAAARNRSFLDRLTPPVRAHVLRRVDEQMAGVVSANLDHLAMAIVAPDLYLTMVTGYCRGKQQALARQRLEPPRDSRSGNGMNQIR